MAWPEDREETYDPTLCYDGENEVWTDDVDILKKSTGRLKHSLIVIAVDEDGNGAISWA